MTAEALDSITVEFSLPTGNPYSFRINTLGGLVDDVDVERIAEGIALGLRQVGFDPVVTRKYERTEVSS